MEPPHFTATEVAERLGVSRRYVYKLIALGRLKGAYRAWNDERAPWFIPVQSVIEYEGQRNEASAHE